MVKSRIESTPCLLKYPMQHQWSLHQHIGKPKHSNFFHGDSLLGDVVLELNWSMNIKRKNVMLRQLSREVMNYKVRLGKTNELYKHCRYRRKGDETIVFTLWFDLCGYQQVRNLQALEQVAISTQKETVNEQKSEFVMCVYSIVPWPTHRQVRERTPVKPII
jgi:hypothetical protein